MILSKIWKKIIGSKKIIRRRNRTIAICRATFVWGGIIIIILIRNRTITIYRPTFGWGDILI